LTDIRDQALQWWFCCFEDITMFSQIYFLVLKLNTILFNGYMQYAITFSEPKSRATSKTSEILTWLKRTIPSSIMTFLQFSGWPILTNKSNTSILSLFQSSRKICPGNGALPITLEIHAILFVVSKTKTSPICSWHLETESVSSSLGKLQQKLSVHLNVTSPVASLISNSPPSHYDSHDAVLKA
jgi:hypothetical protein